MRIVKLILENFRNFREKIEIQFDDMTVFVGANDIGKSTILEALEIFFNNDIVKMEQADLSVKAKKSDNVLIGVVFEDFPNELVIDATASTNLEKEYLLHKNKLEIHKIFSMTTRPKDEVFIFAKHPSNGKFNDLLQLKKNELLKRAEDLHVDVTDVDKRVCSEIRQAIWEKYHEQLEFKVQRIPVNATESKKIWDKLKEYLPTYALFQSDRKNMDQDSEIQDPLKVAVRSVLDQLKEKLSEIESDVKDKVQELANLTIDKLKEMNPTLAETLEPTFSKSPKWESAFNFSLTSDEQVPLNKRGSGVRRMVLLNFFRAEAERKNAERLEKQEKNKITPTIIYALEEPETSQHPDHQKKMVEAFMELSRTDGVQTILTTHSPGIANMIEVPHLRLLEKENGKTTVKMGDDSIYEKISDTLGVLPNILDEVERLKVIVCVEGSTDVLFLKKISSLLEENLAVDFESDERVLLIPLGGCNLKQWSQYRYLKKLKKPEVHIYDTDNFENPTYQKQVDEVNSRRDGSWASSTRKLEIENYVHPEIIESIFKLSKGVVTNTNNANWKEQWNRLDLVSALKQITGIKRQSTLKRHISQEGFPLITLESLGELDALDEIRGWFGTIHSLIEIN